MALTADERETVIVWTDSDDKVRIHTSQRRMVTALLKNIGFEVEEDTVHEGTRMLTGLLPLGSITVRSKAKGSIRRNNGGVKRAMPNVQRCGQPTAAGTPCGSIASKETGRCSKHPK
jgi:hypothetical protein